MSLPPLDVIQELNQLIVASTGIQENDSNFSSCRKFCLSHFVHHSYPTVNKTTVQAALDGFQSRFFMHGHFEVADALKMEVETFLSHQDVFKVNPECEIEWNLLSLLTSLASNLSDVREVPSLLKPFEEEVEPEADFDWANYLKEDLPPLVSFSDSESDSYSLSSLTSVESTECDISSVESDLECSGTEPPSTDGLQEVQDPWWCGALATAVAGRENKLSAVHDTDNKGSFATLCDKLKSKSGSHGNELAILSERKVIEVIFKSLTSGRPLNLSLNSLTYLTKETLSGCLSDLEPYVKCVREFKTFFAAIKQTSNQSVVVKAYASSLRRCLMPYEDALLQMEEQGESLLRVLDQVRKHLSYLHSLSCLHRQCVLQFGKEPPWRTSLRILLLVYANMMESTCEEYYGIYMAMFSTCFAAFAETLDCILTSSYPIHSLQDHIVYRDDSLAEFAPTNMYRAHPFQSLLAELSIGNIPFLNSAVEKIEQTTTSLSLVYLLGRFTDLSKELGSLPSLSQIILDTAYSVVHGQKQLTEPTDGYDICADFVKTLQLSSEEELVQNSEVVDLFDVLSYSENLDCMVPVHREIEKAFHKAIDVRIDFVRTLAKKILFEEHQLERHIHLLRDIMLFNNAAQLIPFTQALFTSKDNFRVDNEEERGHSEMFLSDLLRVCVEADYPDLVSNLSVEVLEFCSNDIFRDIDSIAIAFEVAYPMSMIISAPVLKKYNEIFRAMLKIKWVQSTLCHLPLFDVDEAPEFQSVMQRLNILRFSCLSDMGLIINYFTAQIAGPAHSDFDGCQDIQDFIQEHETRLDRIHTRCMLGDGDQHYTIIFRRVLPFCLELHNVWSLKTQNLMARLKQLENVYRANQVFLNLLMRHLEQDSYAPLGENRAAMSILTATFTSC